MKRYLFVIFSIPMIVIGTNLMMNPWNLDTGQIVASVGLPILDFRAGILDFLEVGASTYARGGYVKLGIKSENFAISGGYAMFPGISGFFADVGLRFETLEIAIGSVYYKIGLFDGGDYNYVLEGEIHYTFKRSESLENGLGIHVYHDTALDEIVRSSLYFDGKFKNVFFFDYITILGGIYVSMTEEGFDPFQSLGVVVGLSSSVRLFK